MSYSPGVTSKDDASLGVTITRSDLDAIIYLLDAAEKQLKNARQVELDIRTLRLRLEEKKQDLEPITQRAATPSSRKVIETTIVTLPDSWPDRGAKKKPTGGFSP